MMDRRFMALAGMTAINALFNNINTIDMNRTDKIILIGHLATVLNSSYLQWRDAEKIIDKIHELLESLPASRKVFTAGPWTHDDEREIVRGAGENLGEAIKQGV